MDEYPHLVAPDDERPHPAGTEQFWGESWYADFVAPDGTYGGYLRLGHYPNLGVSWWTATVVGPDRPLVAATAYDLPHPGGGAMTLDHGPWHLALDAPSPLAAWTVQADTPAVVLDDPAGVYRADPGTPTTMGLDLTFTSDGRPFHYLYTTRYEIPCLVEGTVTVGGERLTLDGQGQRDHSWGERDWWVLAWCWCSVRLEDGTRVHLADIRLPGSPVAFGYVQHDGGSATVTSLEVTEELGAEQLPVSARIRLQPGDLDLAVTPVAHGPLLLTAPDGRQDRFPRAMVTVTAADGRRGAGWIEFNQPPLP